MSAEWFTHYKPIIFAVVWGLVLALAGAWAPAIGEWYKSLQQPSWKPPDWVFGPMWTVIFILAGAAFVMGYHRAPNQETIRMLVILFIVNGLFNFIWSVLYFRMQRPDWALIEAVGLWLSVLAIVLATRSYSPISSLLMLPYLAWVSVAMLLNWTTIQLNGPFGRG